MSDEERAVIDAAKAWAAWKLSGHPGDYEFLSDLMTAVRRLTEAEAAS